MLDHKKKHNALQAPRAKNELRNGCNGVIGDRELFFDNKGTLYWGAV